MLDNPVVPLNTEDERKWYTQQPEVMVLRDMTSVSYPFSCYNRDPKANINNDLPGDFQPEELRWLAYSMQRNNTVNQYQEIEAKQTAEYLQRKQAFIKVVTEALVSKFNQRAQTFGQNSGFGGGGSGFSSGGFSGGVAGAGPGAGVACVGGFGGVAGGFRVVDGVGGGGGFSNPGFGGSGFGTAQFSNGFGGNFSSSSNRTHSGKSKGSHQRGGKGHYVTA